jgi:hypothetical protein
MKKWQRFSLAVTLTALINNTALSQTVTLLKETRLKNYPSASGIVYNENKLFVVGDDAKHILILDTAHRPIDSMLVFPSTTYRLDWKVKPDIESIGKVKFRKKAYLFALSSFSAAHRNKVVLVPLFKSNELHVKSPAGVDDKLRQSGISQPNVEGSTVIKNELVASNRANLSQNINHLIITPLKKKKIENNKRWHIVEITMPRQQSIIGVSGLEYWPEKDWLLFTASTEATNSANEDGEIGESYLGFFEGFSQAKKGNSIQPKILLNISKELKIGNQKIEGVCVERGDEKSLLLHLVADNDNGESILYKVKLSF